MSSNASQCRVLAVRYRALADTAPDPRVRRAYAKLERLWLEMVATAERFDQLSDGEAKERIYAMIDAVGAARHESK